MKIARVIWMSLAFLALQCAGADASGSEAHKVFAKYKCSYTLPGPGWAWQDAATVPGAIFVASNDAGLVVMLMTQRSQLDTVSPEFIRGLEEGAVEPGESSKRGGKSLTFKGVPCHQLDLLLVKVQKTFSSRFFIAHNYVYNLQVVGEKEPVEESPEYDAIMNGFSFTVAPPPPSPQTKANSAAYNAGRRAGQIFMYVLIGAVVIALIRKVSS